MRVATLITPRVIHTWNRLGAAIMASIALAKTELTQKKRRYPELPRSMAVAMPWITRIRKQVSAMKLVLRLSTHTPRSVLKVEEKIDVSVAWGSS